MRDAIKEYLDLTQDEKSELWENAVFVFDTNIFLNLYRYTIDTRKSLLAAMKTLSKRIWMPKQVAQELMKDRTKVIFDTLKIYDDLRAEKEKFINTCREKLRLEIKDIKIDNMSKEMEKHIDILIKESNYIEKVDDDEILNQLLDLFEKKVGEGFSTEELEEIKKEGTERYKKQIPPGYKDFEKGEQNNAFGDLIIWKEILLYAESEKKDIIYVTGDQKEDWWYRVKGHTLGPRIELKKEFYDETGRMFHMYNMMSFLEQSEKMQGSKIEQHVIDEIKSHEELLEEKHRRLHAERLRVHECRRIEQQIMEMQQKLDELDEKQEELNIHLDKLRCDLRNKDKFLDDSLEKMQMSKRILDKMKHIEYQLMDISKMRADIIEELNFLANRRNELMHYVEEV